MSQCNTLAADFTIQLRDGRTMGSASVGKSDGFPIIHCHGSDSSRLEVLLLATVATAQRVRLLGEKKTLYGVIPLCYTGRRKTTWSERVVNEKIRFTTCLDVHKGSTK